MAWQANFCNVFVYVYVYVYVCYVNLNSTILFKDGTWLLWFLY